ncbi:hypothetical protein F2Q68_00008889 [Brassica cretica]|uniref:Uncharacterized protein n=1 Tax=Brassica cretica TaxID=69181 RepID=A0A8S9KSM8_BRACR|nr:hypothetical protein F2Q68_00008889 [Brassica cretica]
MKLEKEEGDGRRRLTVGPLILKQKLIDIAESQMARRGTFSVTFTCNTGGAMRMNIVIKGVHNGIEFLTYDFSDMNVIVISSECGCLGGAQYAQEPDRLCCCRLSRWILTLMPTTYCFIYHGLHFQVGTLRKKKHSFRFNRQRNMHGGVGDEVKESSDDSGMSSFSLRVISNISNCSWSTYKQLHEIQ